jgi:hypothetical protein
VRLGGKPWLRGAWGNRTPEDSGGEQGATPGKAAIVCAEAVDFGLVRMLATHLELGGHPAKVAPFPDLESAKAWPKKDAPG